MNLETVLYAPPPPIHGHFFIPSHPNADIGYTSREYCFFFLHLKKFTVKITVQYPSAAMEWRLNVREEKILAPYYHPGSGD